MSQMSERRIQSAGLLLCLIYLELKNLEVFEFIELEITEMNKKFALTNEIYDHLFFHTFTCLLSTYRSRTHSVLTL
jgi:hypothetical protein